jgi:hypothetical protein
MSSLADRFAEDISLEYSLIDRMRVRGHLMFLQSVGMLSVFFKRWRNFSWIEPRDLQQVTNEFVEHVETMAEKNSITLLSSKRATAMSIRRLPFWRTLPTVTGPFTASSRFRKKPPRSFPTCPRMTPRANARLPVAAAGATISTSSPYRSLKTKINYQRSLSEKVRLCLKTDLPCSAGVRVCARVVIGLKPTWMLQWGHRPIRVVMKGVLSTSTRAGTASMGPPSDKGGYELPIYRHALTRLSFNGSTVR